MYRPPQLRDRVCSKEKQIGSQELGDNWKKKLESDIPMKDIKQTAMMIRCNTFL